MWFSNPRLLPFFFCLSLLLTLITPVIVPGLILNFFAPFLILIYYKKSFLKSLWASFFCGLILDLLSPFSRLGLYTVNYCLTTSFLYSQKKNFFEENLSTLPIMTFFWSILSSVIQVVLLYIFEKGIMVSMGWVVTDLILMSLVDAFYAFAFFILPFLFMGQKPRRGSDYFLS